ncbi:NRT [Mytilus coruscus]|uniref:NRT n=1 Tax=Mytilus coruscus TaxID=42192 RepID=A0A6J8EB48_MYTCO|nr:NRT [Mytilus coruscus]
MSCCTKLLGKIQAKQIEVDDLGKAKQFRLFSIARPHMRSFHSSWFCFFVAFTSWFGIQPLLPTIRKELELSKTDLANSGIASVAATIAVRVIIGPICDKFGPRKTMCCLLITGAIPMALAGLIKTGTGLIVLRLFVGILGGTFVPCQFWTSAMYNSKIVGTANAIAGGWGNLGGGFTFILMPGLFQLMKVIGADEFLAWKLAVVVPSVICALTGT